MDQAEGDGASRTFARDPDTLEVIGDFLVEAEDGLAKADDLLLELERDGFEAERVNAIFRVFHTIKGVAGFVDLRDVATLAHATEALLDELRSGVVDLSQAHLDLTFEATATMRRMLADVRHAVETKADLEGIPELDALLAKLEARLVRGRGEAPPAKPASPPPPMPSEPAAEDAEPIVTDPRALASDAPSERSTYPPR